MFLVSSSSSFSFHFFLLEIHSTNWCVEFQFCIHVFIFQCADHALAKSEFLCLLPCEHIVPEYTGGHAQLHYQCCWPLLGQYHFCSEQTLPNDLLQGTPFFLPLYLVYFLERFLRSRVKRTNYICLMTKAWFTWDDWVIPLTANSLSIMTLYQLGSNPQN